MPCLCACDFEGCRRLYGQRLTLALLDEFADSVEAKHSAEFVRSLRRLVSIQHHLDHPSTRWDDLGIGLLEAAAERHDALAALAADLTGTACWEDLADPVGRTKDDDRPPTPPLALLTDRRPAGPPCAPALRHPLFRRGALAA